MKDFRQLKVWEKAHLLAVAVYPITARFPARKLMDSRLRFGGPLARFPPASLKAAVEMAAELARFCVIARGSATELECQLLLARDLKLLQPDDYEQLSQQTIEIKRMLTVLVQKLTAGS